MFDVTQGAARERLARDEVNLLRGRGALVVDERRTLPQYFDGRFLTALDLTRDQNYFLSRQADFGKASGGGVIHGLLVTEGVTNNTLVIQAGHGITAAGEMVLLPNHLTLNLADLAELQRLNGQLGLSALPAEPQRTRSGLFIVALRPVEFTDNPIAGYPTSLTGPRTVEDSDIVEAVAVTLIPYVDRGSTTDIMQRRAAIARELFVERSPRGVPENALPLAVVALDRGRVRWLDPYLVRREVGALRTSFFGLGQAPRALREAHLLQYREHLLDVLTESGANARIVAADHLRALPPAGPMPLGSLNLANFTQSFFPVEVDVRLTIVPTDELAALVEESLTLPPLDLQSSSDELEATSVLLLLPVERSEWPGLRASLETLERRLKPAVPGLVAMRKPIQALQLLKPIALQPATETNAATDENWRNAARRVATSLGGFKTLWYVRRRNVMLGFQQTGTAQSLMFRGNELLAERELTGRLDELGLLKGAERLKKNASAAANADIVALLASPKLSRSPLLMASALHELEQEKTLDQSAALRITARFDHPKLGEGLRRLEAKLPELTEADSAINKRLITTGLIPELDRFARRLTTEEALTELAEQMQSATSAAKLQRLLEQRLKELPQ